MDDDKQRYPKDMEVLLNRLSLISRYNLCLGKPGPAATEVQREFINGVMDPRLVPTFVAEYETIIESRRRMHKPPTSLKRST